MAPLAAVAASSARALIAAELGDCDAARAAGQVLCGTRGCDGAVDRYLGLAAAAVGDRTGCDRWLRSALVIHERLGSPTYLARTLYDRARLLADVPARDHALLVARRHHLVALAAALASEVFARGARLAR